MLEVIERHPPAEAKSTPLVFVHGAWHGAWCWDEFFMPYFASHGYACHALSLRGHGASAGRDRLRWTRVRDFVTDVMEVVDGLPVPPVLVGHSAGGFVVMKYLEQRAAAGAVLVSPIPPGGVARTALKIARRYPRAFLAANLRLSLAPVVETPEMARSLFFSASMPPEQLRVYHARLQDESYLAFIDLLALDLVRRKKLHQVPTLVLGAENDALISQRQIRRTVDVVEADVEIFPGMAHDLMLEEGWKHPAERMLDWLDARFV